MRKADDAGTQRKIDQVLAAYASQVWDILAIEMIEPMQDAGASVAETATAEVQVSADVQIQGLFDVVNQDAVDYAHERAAEMVGKRLVNGILIENPAAKWRIDESTRQWVRDQIEAAFAEGMSPAELAKSIREDYAFSKSRAQTIAHAEVANINIRTRAKASIEGGAQFKRSRMSMLHDHDDFCDDAQAQGIVPIDHDYGLGILWPLYHLRCMCTITFYWNKPEK